MIKYVSLILLLILGLHTTLPSLSAKRGKKSKDIPLSETLFMEQNFSEKSLKDWDSGREFLCVTDELPVLLAINENAEPKQKSFKDKIFTYKIIQEESNWQGKESSILFEYGGNNYRYKVKKGVADILDGDFKPLLPELVPLDYISQADSLLKGSKLYIKTPRWRDSTGVETNGRKFVPVTITAVEPGDKILPLRVVFRDETGKISSLLTTMYVNTLSAQYTTFDRLFSFSNPKLKYPNIKEDVWQQITSCRVMPGMTKDECSLSLGHPNNVRQMPGYSGLREQWMYNVGVYLVFQDGLLVDFRL